MQRHKIIAEKILVFLLLNQLFYIIIACLFQVNENAADRLHQSFVSQAWGVSTLGVVLVICPLLALLSKNAISSIQVRKES